MTSVGCEEPHYDLSANSGGHLHINCTEDNESCYGSFLRLSVKFKIKHSAETAGHHMLIRKNTELSSLITIKYI